MLQDGYSLEYNFILCVFSKVTFSARIKNETLYSMENVNIYRLLLNVENECSRVFLIRFLYVGIYKSSSMISK